MAGKCEPRKLKVEYCCHHLRVFKGKAEICVLLSHYTACSGDSLPTFRDSLSVPFSGAKNPSWFLSFWILGP